MPTIDAKTFKALVKSGTVSPNLTVAKAVQPQDVEISEAQRKATFVISTDTVDRDQDSIDVKGWQLDNYHRNPTVLFGHNQDSLPIGRAKVYQEGVALKAEVEFAPSEVNPLAENVYQGVKQGFIHATSVGFRPIDFDISDDEDRHSKSGRLPPIDFKSVELLELSIVTVPSNPDAVLETPVELASDAGPKHFSAAKAKRKRALALLELV